MFEFCPHHRSLSDSAKALNGIARQGLLLKNKSDKHVHTNNTGKGMDYREACDDFLLTKKINQI